MPSASPSYSPSDAPTDSPSIAPSYLPSFSPTNSPSLINIVPLDPEAECQFDINLYIDVSKSVSAEYSAGIADMLSELLSQWFNMTGDGRSILEKTVRVRVSVFASRLKTMNTFESSSASNGLKVMRLYRRGTKISGRGTRTDLIFQDLVQEMNPTIIPPSKQMVLIVTDGEPYVVDSKRNKIRMLRNAGLPTNVKLFPRLTGRSLHYEYLQRFRDSYPEVPVLGMSLNRLPETFLDNTFDSYYLKYAMNTTISMWSSDVTYLMCATNATATAPPTSPAPVCNFKRKRVCQSKRKCTWSQGACTAKES